MIVIALLSVVILLLLVLLVMIYKLNRKLSMIEAKMLELEQELQELNIRLAGTEQAVKTLVELYIEEKRKPSNVFNFRPSIITGT